MAIKINLSSDFDFNKNSDNAGVPFRYFTANMQCIDLNVRQEDQDHFHFILSSFIVA